MKDILKEISPVFGFCPFDKIRDSLIDCRAKSRIPENTKTVIVLLFPYNFGDEAYQDSDISRYAVVPDYHVTIGNILQEAVGKLTESYPDEEFTAFTDNSPIPEVRAAMYAGLGVRGLNGLFFNKDFGSWVFIGEIVTTLQCDYPDITDEDLMCIRCGKCVSACPTKAIGENGIDAQKCLSYITQKKGELTAEQEQLIKKSNCAWGCDVCQSVCPMNKGVKAEPIEIFRNGAEFKARTQSDISDRAYAWRGKNVIERNLKILNR